MNKDLIKQYRQEYQKEEEKREDRQLRNSPEYRQWRESVFERDKYTCQNCGSKKGRLEDHHIKGWKRYKKLRFDINNGKTLCQKCHIKTYKKYLINYWKKRREENIEFWS